MPEVVSEKLMACRVLVVEDNQDCAESLRMLLELAGHEVEVAYDGASALARAREWHPDAVLCDIGLPGELNGYDVARRMRDDPVLAGVYLLALTGYGQEEDRLLSEEAGFDVHLVKPVAPQLLESLLAGVKKSRRVPSSDSSAS